MENKMENAYYKIEEIRSLFNSYREGSILEMNETEFEIFCCAFKTLPKDIVDRVRKEIHFVYMKDDIQNNVVSAAFHIDLGEEALKEKIGIILLTPYVIGSPYQPEYTREDGFQCMLDPSLVIAHEIAHHILGHKAPDNIGEKEQQHREVGELVERWFLEYDEDN